MQKSTRRRIGIVAVIISAIAVIGMTTSTANAMGTGGHTAERVVR